MALATLSYGGSVIRFRTNPNQIRWSYRLKTSVTNTYGGRVIQLLSANIDDLVVTADAGAGGWDYLHQIANQFRDFMVYQKNTGTAGVFEYPNRGWSLGVYALNFPFKDSVTDVKREFTMQFKVQEDISGVVTTQSLDNEIARLKEGIGWSHNEYNTPDPEGDALAMNAGSIDERPKPIDSP